MAEDNTVTQVAQLKYSNLAHAIAYATRYGWFVFPLHEVLPSGACSCGKVACKNPGKHPRTRHGLRDASADPVQIRTWWTMFPNAPIAIVCGGQSGPIVIDVDPPEGDVTWQELVLKYGVQHTITAKTGGGGEHIYFSRHQLPVQSKMGGLGPGVDLCADGHYVIAPPSLHKSGQRYEFREGMGPADMSLAPCPDWVLEVSSQFRSSQPPPPPGGGHNKKQQLHPEASEKGWLATAFDAVGWLGTWHPVAGAWLARCPWSQEHSDGRGDGKDSSTIVYPPGPGKSLGYWKCEHGHCGGRTIDDVRKALPVEALIAANKAYPPRPKHPQPTDNPNSDSIPPPMQIDPRTGEVLNEGDWTDELRRDQKTDSIISCIANANLILSKDRRWQGVLAYDGFSYQYVYLRPAPWEKDSTPNKEKVELQDNDGLRLSIWLHRKWGIKLGHDICYSLLQAQCECCEFNRLQEWLTALKWDGVQRIKTWTTKYLNCEDTAYHRAAGYRWIISAVARAMKPGCRADLVLIMEGDQGVKKSTAIGVLASEQYFAELTGDLANKDSWAALRGKWILEISEMLSAVRTDNETWKAYASRCVDHYRDAYGRTTKDVPRTCVFCGTTNAELYLSDETGARRNLAIKCGKIDVEGLARDREQLWAEAMHAFNAGEQWWLTDDEQPLQVAEQENRRELDPWHGRVSDWLDEHKHTDLVTVPRILRDCINLEPKNQDLRSSRRVGKILRILKWQRGALTRNAFAAHRSDYVYLPPGFKPETPKT